MTKDLAYKPCWMIFSLIIFVCYIKNRHPKFNRVKYLLALEKFLLVFIGKRFPWIMPENNFATRNCQEQNEGKQELDQKRFHFGKNLKDLLIL